jgi:membrane protein
MQLVERVKHLIVEEIWELESSQLTRFRALLYKQLRFFSVVASGFNESQVRLQALALSFKLMISLAPLLAVAFSVLKAFGVQNRLKPALAEALAPLGPQGDEITNRLLEFVNNMNVGALGSIGLITLFMTVVSLITSVEGAFNQIWKIKTARPLTRKVSDYLSTVMIGPVLIFSAVGVTASLQSSGLVKKLIGLEPFGSLLVFALRLTPYLTVWAAFALLYVFVPNTKVKLKSALLGGLVGAVLWQTVGWGFAVFVAASTKYYAIYSGFAILLLFLLWIYYGWIILLFGAQVAFAHQNFRISEREWQPHGASVAAREGLALRAMVLIAQSFYFQKPGWTAAELAVHLQVPHSLMDQILAALRDGGLIVETGKDHRLFPGRDLERIELSEIIGCVRTHGDRAKLSHGNEGMEDPVAAILEEVDESLKNTLQGKTLRSLVFAGSANDVARAESPRRA